MPRYKLLIEYDGTAYCGWQRQPDVPTIEGTIEQGMSQILQVPVNVIAQGRTDSGVHAEAQTAHVDLPQSVDPRSFLHGMRGVLPRDICIWKIQPVAGDFHARFDARARHYRYQIVSRPHPLLQHVSHIVTNPLDFAAMGACAKMVQGTHDFRNFGKMKDKDAGAECVVARSVFTKQDEMLIYHIHANRFVHHMVRRLVGSMLQAGRGKWTVSRFKRLLAEPTSTHHAQGVAARGLILKKVVY